MRIQKILFQRIFWCTLTQTFWIITSPSMMWKFAKLMVSTILYLVYTSYCVVYSDMCEANPSCPHFRDARFRPLQQTLDAYFHNLHSQGVRRTWHVEIVTPEEAEQLTLVPTTLPFIVLKKPLICCHLSTLYYGHTFWFNGFWKHGDKLV